MLSNLSLQQKEAAFQDLQSRFEAWVSTWATEDPELDPEEEVDAEDLDTPEMPSAPVQAPPDDGYPAHLWNNRKPGSVGFNAHARDCVRKARIGEERGWQPHALGQFLFKHQAAVAFFVHPRSPFERLLVDHATGSGKTLLMLALTENFFFDPRPKILIFPKEHVCANFYQHRLRWPGRWRDYFCLRDPHGARLACGGGDWRARRFEQWDLSNRNPALQEEMNKEGCDLEKVVQQLVKSVREVLEMKKSFRSGAMRSRFVSDFRTGHAEEFLPAAPLRAYRFTSAGGRAASLDEKGVPLSGIFRMGFCPQEGNVYSGKVVIMDEGHHLTRPHKQFEFQLGNLRKRLYSATKSVVVVCTGTIAADKEDDARQLLDQVKGQEGAALCDEGFVSAFHQDSVGKPREVPPGLTQGAFGHGVTMELSRHAELEGEAARRFAINEARGVLEKDPDPLPKLRNYSNMYVNFGSIGNVTCKHNIVTDLLREPPIYAPKLVRVVEAVIEHRRKSLVMISRRTGYQALLALFRKAALHHGFRVATADERADFNDERNLRGERFLVLVADSDKVGEGVEFLGVREHHLVDVPLSYLEFKQNIGRSVRMFGHDKLPIEEREVRFHVWVAVLPEFAQTEVGAFALRALCGHWTGPAKRNYSAEPPADHVVDMAEELTSRWQRDGIHSAGSLGLENVPDELVERLGRKLLGRLGAGFAGLDGGDEVMVQSADERLLERLVLQASRLTPAVEQIRLSAVDRGLYQQ